MFAHNSCESCLYCLYLCVLRDASSRSKRLHCPQFVSLFSKPSASRLFFFFLCLCLTISLWNTLFFPLFLPLFLKKKTCSNLCHLQLYALSATAVRPWGALMRTSFCLFPACDLTSLLFPCRSSLRVLVLNLVENQICFHCALFFSGQPPFTSHKGIIWSVWIV